MVYELQGQIAVALVEDSPPVEYFLVDSICEVEDFVETHICELCVILRSCVLLGVCPHEGYKSATPLGTTVACTRVNRVMVINLCSETIKPVLYHIIKNEKTFQL